MRADALMVCNTNNYGGQVLYRKQDACVPSNLKK